MLLDTVGQLLTQELLATEIILVDQTKYLKEDRTAQALTDLQSKAQVRWIRKSEPSIPKAMNCGLLEAKSEWVLFLDDDINVGADFVASHLKIINSKQALAHVGQVVQPWQEPNQRYTHYRRVDGLLVDLNFPFNSHAPKQISNCMAGNLCVNRWAAIKAGGFDENFFGPAYRFETEFCRRFTKKHSQPFLYHPGPVLNHLYISSGGTRAHGHHLTSATPAHSMGDYYFALLQGHGVEKWRYILRRFFASVMAKFYVTHPWYIPVRIWAEARGLFAAIKATSQGQALIHETLIKETLIKSAWVKEKSALDD